MKVQLASPSFGMPWDAKRADAQKFRKALTSALVIVLAVGVAMPWLPLPEVEREELEELPPQLARILLEKQEIEIPPPPPPKPVEPEPTPDKPEPEPEQIVKQETVVEPQPTVADAREKAKTSGLLQFADAFADMRDAVDVSTLQDTASIQRGAGESATIDRNLLTSQHSTRSAGVNVAALSRDTGGVALSGREVTKVDAPKGATGEGGTRERKLADPRSRSIEEIRRVFDTNKGAIFAIYNRALRQDPSLMGKVVLELVIDPNGRVVDVSVVSSELADDGVIAKIINRVRLFDFGKRDVRTTTISYPVHFLPS